MRNTLKTNITPSPVDAGHRGRATALVLAGLLAASSANVSAQVIWSDEFDSGSAPDESVWSYDLGSGGWGNQEIQTYTKSADNVRVEGGNLVITALESMDGDVRGFTSGRLRTENKLTIQYGTIEMRFKVPDLANGLWPAFWMLGNNFNVVGWPASGEIDILEMGHSSAISGGVVNRKIGSAAHWSNNGENVSYAGSLTADTDLDNGFHVVKLDWTPSSLTTYLDGEQIWVMDISSEACSSCEELHEPQFMILNLAVGGSYTGITDANMITATLPAQMLIDYIRIHDNGHTVLGGPVAEAMNPWVMKEYSGSWYNDTQSGHGFSIEFGKKPNGTPRAVVYWYLYDDQGNPIFMTGTGTPDGNRVEINFKSPTGMEYGVFDPASVERPDGGTAVFEFTDSGNGTFSYTPSEFSVSTWGHSPIMDLPIVKLFAIPVSTITE